MSSTYRLGYKWGGLPGYLAKAFDTEDLAHGIAWVLAQGATGPSGGLLGQQAREKAEARFAAPVVAAQYRAVYEHC